MGGKSGGGGTNWKDVQIAKDKADREDRLRAEEDTKAAQTETARREAWHTGMQQGEGSLRNRATQRIKTLGLNPDEYGGFITDAIEGVKGRVSENDADPAKMFTDDVIDNTLSRVRDDRRTMYTNAVNSHYTPGFENQHFGSNSDDPFINEVLGRQKGEAMSYLQRAKERGQVNDAGYNAALGRIGEMERTGLSTANKLGDAVLQGNRTRLRDFANEVKSTAGAYELGGTFNLDAQHGRHDELLGGMRNNLEGDIRGALEGQKFFDVGDLITRAGAAQGAVNPTSVNADALAAAAKQRDTRRGVGGSGGF
jgi:hypothetical protein